MLKAAITAAGRPTSSAASWQLIDLIGCPAVFAAVDKADLIERLPKCGGETHGVGGAAWMEEPDHWHRWLLRARRERPRGRRAAEKRDDLASP